MRAMPGKPVIATLFILLVLVPGTPPRAQEDATPEVPRAREALILAASEQEDIVTRLNEILKEQRIALSDGALLGILQNLIVDEQNMIEGIKDLGRRTLGKTAEELTEDLRGELQGLTRDQESVVDRFTSFQRGAETKAMERPTSPFAQVILLAAETNISQRIEATPGILAGNQLARALQEVTDILSVLEQMEAILSGGEESKAGPDASGELSFQAPALWKAESALPSFPWTGDVIDTLGAIMRSVSDLEEQAKKQREIADKVKGLADGGSKEAQPNLVTQEGGIRQVVLGIREKLGIVDPVMDSEIGLGVDQIDVAVPHLETGALPLAVDPTRSAAEHLTAAAESLKATWNDILDRLAEYSAEAELMVGSAVGVPHGASKEFMEKLQFLILALLRVTRGMTETIQQQILVRDYTLTAADEPASATMDAAAIGMEQRKALDILATQVIPFNILAPPYDARHAPLKTKNFISHLLIEDASANMQFSEDRVASGKLDRALTNQEKALDFLEEAMAEMVLTLQKLLGQYSPQAVTPASSVAAGLALRGDSSGALLRGWVWELPERERVDLEQAFRGNFPERYADLIERYYRMIAREEE